MKPQDPQCAELGVSRSGEAQAGVMSPIAGWNLTMASALRQTAAEISVSFLIADDLASSVPQFPLLFNVMVSTLEINTCISMTETFALFRSVSGDRVS